MDTFKLDHDIPVLSVVANSFPEGILQAHEDLHKLIPFSMDRNYFGLSRPENGGPIIYRAAAEEKEPGEAEKYQSDRLIIKQGEYASIILRNFRNSPQKIGEAFQELLAVPNLDPEGYCVEWYANDKEEVRCMVRLDQ